MTVEPGHNAPVMPLAPGPEAEHAELLGLIRAWGYDTVFMWPVVTMRAEDLDPEDPKLKPYILEVLGPPTDDVNRHPVGIRILDPHTQAETIAVAGYRVRVYNDGNPVVLERTSWPDGAIFLSLRGLNAETTQDQIDRAWDGRYVIGIAEANSRRRGPVPVDRLVRQQELIEAALKIEGKITRASVGQVLGLKPMAVSTRFRMAGVKQGVAWLREEVQRRKGYLR